MVKHLPFKLPNLKSLSDKSDISRWTRMCTKNRTSIMVWNSRFFPKISDGEPKYEYRYNIKAVHISLEDLQYLKDHLHPDDYWRYAPVGDSKVEKGMCNRTWTSCTSCGHCVTRSLPMTGSTSWLRRRMNGFPCEGVYDNHGQVV